MEGEREESNLAVKGPCCYFDRWIGEQVRLTVLTTRYRRNESFIRTPPGLLSSYARLSLSHQHLSSN